jgi:hypothetical protein
LLAFGLIAIEVAHHDALTQSGRGQPHSKTLARFLAHHSFREALVFRRFILNSLSRLF